MAIRDFSEQTWLVTKVPLSHPANLTQWSRIWFTLHTTSRYVPMDASTMGIPKLQFPEIQVTTPKNKISRGWLTCPKRSPPEATFQQQWHLIPKVQKAVKTIVKNPAPMRPILEHRPNEKNMRAFNKLNVTEHVDITCTFGEETVLMGQPTMSL